MSTLKEFRDSYYEFSGIASEVSRKLGFAGIAVIWIFKAEASATGRVFTLAPELYLAGVFIVLSLALDLLHYILASFIWGAFWRYHEKYGVTEKKQIEAPSWFNWPTLLCFWSKLVLMVVAYYFLLKFLLVHISPDP